MRRNFILNPPEVCPLKNVDDLTRGKTLKEQNAFYYHLDLKHWLFNVSRSSELGPDQDIVVSKVKTFPKRIKTWISQKFVSTGNLHRCSRLPNVNLVTGEVINNLLICSAEREAVFDPVRLKDNCGPEGKYYKRNT